MEKLNENMMRKHNWDQLQIIQKQIDKQGGDISSKLGTDYKRQSKTANSYWINNPLKKNIALSDNEPNANTHTDPQLKDLPKNSLLKENTVKTFEQFAQENELYDRQIKHGIVPEIKPVKNDCEEKLPIGRNDNPLENEDIFNKLEYMLYQKMKDEDFSGDMTFALTGTRNPSEKEIIDTIKSLDNETIEDFILNESKKENKDMKKEESQDMKKEEPQDRGNVNDIHRQMKTIRNWNNYFNDAVGGTPNAKKERNVLAGRQVDLGDDKKEGYIEGIQDNKVVVQTTDGTGHKLMTFDEIIKNYNIKSDEVKGPKEEKPIEISQNGEVKKLDDKATETKDSKNLQNIYSEKEVKIKKLQDFGKTTF